MKVRRMMTQIRRFARLTPLLLAAVALPANASLIVDSAVTSFFIPHATTTDTVGNDLPLPRPSTLYFGQVRATGTGVVDFFYIGKEAGFTNKFYVKDNLLASTASQPDSFNAPFPLIGSLAVSAGQLLDFGFCTDGGDKVLGSRCVWNDSALSIVSQYNHDRVGGYRSIGYATADIFDPATGARSFGSGLGPSDNLFAFWDDSGARNDDNHDDMIIGMRFTRVDEPTSLALAATGLLGLLWVGSRRNRGASRAA
ncbi:hypothetical protein GPROT2_01877 [Gammaproteobacteria bacterium]|nr:hypothetical protein GPROT2_01877 [Gammaproteobacteria bacterium]